jgi:hypothetical protein
MNQEADDLDARKLADWGNLDEPEDWQSPVGWAQYRMQDIAQVPAEVNLPIRVPGNPDATDNDWSISTEVQNDSLLFCTHVQCPRNPWPWNRLPDTPPSP